MWALNFPFSDYSSSGRPTWYVIPVIQHWRAEALELWSIECPPTWMGQLLAPWPFNSLGNAFLLLPSNHWTIGIMTIIDHSEWVVMQRSVWLAIHSKLRTQLLLLWLLLDTWELFTNIWSFQVGWYALSGPLLMVKYSVYCMQMRPTSGG